jgi:hypothetical protein
MSPSTTSRLNAVGATTNNGATRHLNMLFVTLVRSEPTQDDSGSPYVTMWLRVANRNDVPLQLSTYDFKVVLANGSSQSTYFSSPSPELQDTVLNPNGSVYGSISFSVPSGTHHVTLTWAPSPCGFEVHWPVASWSAKF